MLQKVSQPSVAWQICIFIIFCDSVIRLNAAPQKDCHYRKNCQGMHYDIREAVCCENQLYTGAGLSCCGNQVFNPENATCCKLHQENRFTVQLTPGMSEMVSACCGLMAYDPLNEICLNSTVAAKTVPKAQICSKDVYDEDKQLCCGPLDDKKILMKITRDHRCCGHDQYNMKTQWCCEVNQTLQIENIQPDCSKEYSASCRPKLSCCGKVGFDKNKQLCCGPLNDKKVLMKNSPDHQCCGHDQVNTSTHCCCGEDETLKIKPINSTCCQNKPGVQQKKHAPNRIEHDSVSCKSKQTKHHCCCNAGHCDATDNDSQCCGETPAGLAQHRVVCYNNTMFKDGSDGEEYTENRAAYEPTKGTVCCSDFHASPGKHCCGTKIYYPNNEICCNGHSYPKGGNIQCCGIKAYNITDPQMKCCSGVLHNLTSLGSEGNDAQCCGSILRQSQDVCCSSGEREFLYSTKPGFRCCGHFYYNISLWSCCAGKLSPGQHHSKEIKESTFLSVSNLNEEELCEELQIRTVESVSLNSIVFSSVLKIQGKNATVIALPSPYVMEIPDHCSTPKLVPGKIYFFDGMNILTDFNHHSAVQLIHFIFSKCYSP
ncbi:usherin [Mastacembelus armatus]|uniref:usherin n=1 Tax=Mastacembelus armatus TaxID=205130 RepID=UPI000E454CC3|nr:usherin-like [Mastacembelus armatus]